MDTLDPLGSSRKDFHFPKHSDGTDIIYFTGNSLGLSQRPRAVMSNRNWTTGRRLGVEGHMQAKNPWLPYHEFRGRANGAIIGAKADRNRCDESLTVNLHLLMVSFYRPIPTAKIVIEKGAFPSDRYAVDSQLAFHNICSPAKILIELAPRGGEIDTCERKILLK